MILTCLQSRRYIRPSAPSGYSILLLLRPKDAIGNLNLGQLIRSPHSRRWARAAPDTLETVSAIATTGCSSALPDVGDFLKRRSVQPAGRSAFKFFEQSLSTHCRTSIFPEAEVQRPKSPASRGFSREVRCIAGLANMGF